MKLTKDFKIYNAAAECLKAKSVPVVFPLNQETIENIEYLKACFKKTLSSSITTIGLSAPQVGINQRFYVVPQSLNYASYHSTRLKRFMLRNFKVVINPEITFFSEQSCEMEEVCLSVEGVYRIKRSQKIGLSYFDTSGSQKVEQLAGLMARVAQHEIDHLEGITILDKEGQKIEQLDDNQV